MSFRIVVPAVKKHAFICIYMGIRASTEHVGARALFHFTTLTLNKHDFPFPFRVHVLYDYCRLYLHLPYMYGSMCS